MKEAPGNLTVRVVMTPTPTTEPSFLSRYRWDRILLVAGLLGLLALVFYWLLGSTPAPVAEKRPETATDQRGDGPVASRRSDAGEMETGVPQPLAPVDQGLDKPTAGSVRQGDLLDYAGSESVAPAMSGERDGDPTDAMVDPVYEAPIQSSPEVAETESARPGLTQEPPTAVVDQPREQRSAASVPASSQRPSGALSPLATLGTEILSPRVARFVITDNVVAREPVGDISDIMEDEANQGLVRVFAFSAVRDLAGQTIHYRWRHDGKIFADIPVKVGSPAWRSYSSKYLSQDMRGRWRVELVVADGQLLAFTEFEY